MKHFGLLVPASNIVAEKELYTRLIRENIDDVYFHFARLKFQTPYGQNEEKYTKELVESIPEALAEMKRINLCRAAVLCTSAEIYYKPQDELIFPLTSVIAYFKMLGRKSPLVISPYNSDIGERVTQRLKISGINIPKEFHLNIKTKEELLSFSNAKLAEMIEQELIPEIDSICILCTNFSTLHLETMIEQKFNIPFISSNRAIYEQLKHIDKNN